MAALDQVVGDSALRLPDIPGRIEHALAYLRNEWEDLPDVAAGWDGWDEASRLHFVVDWPIRESHLALLREWDKHGLLTPEQRARYQSLLTLIDALRPTLERLLND